MLTLKQTQQLTAKNHQ